jgi:hypothetical protein
VPVLVDFGFIESITALIPVPYDRQVEAVPQIFEVSPEGRPGYFKRREEPVHSDRSSTLQHRLDFVEALSPIHRRPPFTYLLFVYHWSIGQQWNIAQSGNAAHPERIGHRLRRTPHDLVLELAAVNPATQALKIRDRP